MMQDKNDEHGIGGLLMRHRNSLYGYLLTCVRDSHQVEDILQEVAQIAIESIDQLRNKDRFASWLFGIARNRVLLHRRKSERERVLPADVVELLASEAEHIDEPYHIERKEALHECLKKLPERSQQIITQRYDGSIYQVEELAGQVGRTVQATYALLKRIRMKLADCVRNKMGEVKQ